MQTGHLISHDHDLAVTEGPQRLWVVVALFVLKADNFDDVVDLSVFHDLYKKNYHIRANKTQVKLCVCSDGLSCPLHTSKVHFSINTIIQLFSIVCLLYIVCLYFHIPLYAFGCFLLLLQITVEFLTKCNQLTCVSFTVRFYEIWLGHQHKQCKLLCGICEI